MQRRCNLVGVKCSLVIADFKVRFCQLHARFQRRRMFLQYPAVPTRLLLIRFHSLERSQLGFRRFNSLEFSVGDGEVIVRLNVIGREFNCFLIELHRRRQPIFHKSDASGTVVSLGEGAIQRDCLLIRLLRRRQFSSLDVDIA